ncbi:hypothetical protein D3C80_1308070 [compost metagenome]
MQVVLLLVHQPTWGHEHQPADPLRLVQRQLDGDGTAQGVADQYAALDIQGIEQPAQGTDEKVQAIDRLRLARSAVTGQVGDDHPIPGRGECRVVLFEVAMPAGARAAAVDEHHRLARANILVMQLQTIGQRYHVPLR